MKTLSLAAILCLSSTGCSSDSGTKTETEDEDAVKEASPNFKVMCRSCGTAVKVVRCREVANTQNCAGGDATLPARRRCSMNFKHRHTVHLQYLHAWHCASSQHPIGGATSMGQYARPAAGYECSTCGQCFDEIPAGGSKGHQASSICDNSFHSAHYYFQISNCRHRVGWQ